MEYRERHTVGCMERIMDASQTERKMRKTTQTVQ
jgi:hypothetical protein